MRRLLQLASVVVGPALALLQGCTGARLPELPTVASVDLPRFMGNWYVIASIPTFIERGAHNAVESYALRPDGTIATTFTFRAGSFTGKRRQYHPRGFVLDRQSNARWGMQFVWPVKADYRVTWLANDYSQTVIARRKRDNVWIMARTPAIPAADYERMLQHIAALGYDIAKVQRVPQRWPAP
jgi:apolipoprotein D and lipocalin family protein